LQPNKRANKKENLNELKGTWTVAEIEISYKPIITNHTIISSSFHAHELIKQLWDKEKINFNMGIYLFVLFMFGKPFAF